MLDMLSIPHVKDQSMIYQGAEKFKRLLRIESRPE
jgi:hypothetical protein